MRRSDFLRATLEYLPTQADVRPGEVFYVQDNVFEFPDAMGASRTLHENRYCIVAQSASLWSRPDLATVQVVPCTHKVPKKVPDFELVVPAGVAGFPKETLALVSITQAIPKVALASEKLGRLPPELMIELEQRLARIHGVRSLMPLAATSKLPPPTRSE